MTPSAYPRVASAAADASIIITNVSSDPTRATVRFNDEVALEVELAGSINCGHEPLFSYHYDVPPGRYQVEGTTDAGRHQVRSMRVGERRMWITVQTQEGFPLYLTVTKQKLQFG